MNLLLAIRNVIDKFFGVYNLKEFGAFLDGSTDDKPAIDRFVSFIGAVPCTLLVPGQCSVANNVTIPSTVKVRFEAGGAFVGAGVVTYLPWDMTAFVKASYFGSTNQSIPHTTFTVINFDTKVYDSHNAVATGAGWTFTCPAGRGGVYKIAAAANYAPGAVTITNLILDVFKNGVFFMRLYQWATTGGSPVGAGNFEISGGGDILLAPTDTLAVEIYHANSGASAQPLLGGQTYVWTTILGPF